MSKGWKIGYPIFDGQYIVKEGKNGRDEIVATQILDNKDACLIAMAPEMRTFIERVSLLNSEDWDENELKAYCIALSTVAKILLQRTQDFNYNLKYKLKEGTKDDREERNS